MTIMGSKMPEPSSLGFGEWPLNRDVLRIAPTRRFRAVYGWLRNRFTLEEIPPGHRPACSPADRKFRCTDVSWSPLSSYEWGQYDIISWRADDVITFRGWVAEREGQSRRGSFGATASYVMHPDNLSRSISGRWISAPTVSVSGTIVGKTKPFTLWDPFENEQYAQCWMVCRQRIFQAGPDGDLVLCEREEVRTLFCHENGGASDAMLPGTHAMPALNFEIPLRDSDLLAELSIRFDFQLAGHDSRIDLNDHPVRLRFRPWEPMVA